MSVVDRGPLILGQGMFASIFCRFSFASSSWPLIESFGAKRAVPGEISRNFLACRLWSGMIIRMDDKNGIAESGCRFVANLSVWVFGRQLVVGCWLWVMEGGVLDGFGRQCAGCGSAARGRWIRRCHAGASKASRLPLHRPCRELEGSESGLACIGDDWRVLAGNCCCG